jgi:integrase
MQVVPISSVFTMSLRFVAIRLPPRGVAGYIRAMSKTRARHGTYIFQRGSTWYVKLQSPTCRVEKSLRTSDFREAEIAALPLIAEHKAALLANRPKVTLIWHRAHEPGLRVIDGEQAIVTERELQFIDASGNVVRREPNGGPAQLLTPAPSSGVPSFKAFDDAKRPTPAVKNGDDGIMETYLNHRNITGHKRREAEASWALYKSLIGKPLKTATRDDGRLLAQHFKAAGNKSATVVKKIGWLRAAVRLAIKEGQLQFNPFAEVVSENGDDELRRKPLSDADMELCKKNLGLLSKSDQLLFRFLATTGARLGEAFQIDGEQKERDIRYVMIGSKTEASQRRLPLPSALIPFLPDKIVGPLFAATPSIELASKAASKRLNDFLDECGLKEDKSIVVHSLRHRAADRLRAYECPIDIRHALLGHETRSVAEGYGSGFPVTVLKLWIDKIGGP